VRKTVELYLQNPGANDKEKEMAKSRRRHWCPSSSVSNAQQGGNPLSNLAYRTKRRGEGGKEIGRTPAAAQRHRSHRHIRPSLPKNFSALAEHLGKKNSLKRDWLTQPRDQQQRRRNNGAQHFVSLRGLSPTIHSDAFSVNNMSGWRGSNLFFGLGNTTSLFSYSHPVQPSMQIKKKRKRFRDAYSEASQFKLHRRKHR
jgi:hypothetical protein